MFRSAYGKTLMGLALSVVAITLLSAGTARASILNYVFAGSATGTVDGTPSPGFVNFTLSYTGDTSTIDNRGGGYYSYDHIDAAIAALGYSAVLKDIFIETNGNPGFQNIDFYDNTFTNGLGLANNAALLGYMLATPVSTGIVTGSNLTPTTSGGTFTTSVGDTIQLTGVSQLSFTASAPVTSPVPEPSTLLLLSTGLPGIGLLRRRFFA